MATTRQLLALAVDEALLLRIEQLERRVTQLEEAQRPPAKKATPKPAEKN